MAGNGDPGETGERGFGGEDEADGPRVAEGSEAEGAGRMELAGGNGDDVVERGGEHGEFDCERVGRNGGCGGRGRRRDEEWGGGSEIRKSE